MKLFKKIDHYKKFEIILVIIALFYYLFFINKGIVLFDEGYFVHSADRILNGELPYKDFSLQYGPTYFYLLALFFKLFGATIIVERWFAVLICLGILGTIFLIINKLQVKSYLLISLSFLCIVAYGYPLINIPNIMWTNVLTALVALLVYLNWLTTQERKADKHIFMLGILLALSLSLKQNIGITCVVFFNFLLLFSKKQSVLQASRNLAILNITMVIVTFGWIYYFFLRDNISGLITTVEFSKKFVSSTAFSIPPLSLALQPLGIFKLLPYYTPIFFALFLLYHAFQRKKEWGKFAFALLATVGFIVTIFPQSDLLHVYPFLGVTLVSLLIFSRKSNMNFFVICLICIQIITGFYLTFFTRSNRYESPYLQMNSPLSLPKTSGIMMEKEQAENLIELSHFMNAHTKPNDYILVYPYAPLLYFILERKNPTKDPIYYLRTWHFYDDEVALDDMRKKHVTFIVVTLTYQYNTQLSHFIEKQKKVFTSHSSTYSVYEVTSHYLKK